MSRSLRSTGFLIIFLLLAAAVAGAFLSATAAAPAGAADDIRISSARDFLFAWQPPDPAGDSVVVTAQLFKGGQPLHQAGVPVSFSLSDGRFAALEENTAYTDEWGMATTRLRSYNSGQDMEERPFLLAVTASANGKSSGITLPITHYVGMNGTVRNKSGSPVWNAKVAVLYNRTHSPINARGATSTTGQDGTYRLERVPTDLGDLVIYARKGNTETYMPASLPAGS